MATTIFVLIIWMGTAAAVSYALIGSGHWIAGMFLMMLAMSGIKINSRD